MGDNMDTIIRYYDNMSVLMALLIKKEHHGNGIEFLTEEGEYMQVACMEHPKGYVIASHYHNRIERMIDYSCETLVMKKGKMRVTLFDNQIPIHNFDILEGDILTLFSGGHGFEMCDDVEMVEIKQGPYPGINDKTRF